MDDNTALSSPTLKPSSPPSLMTVLESFVRTLENLASCNILSEGEDRRDCCILIKAVRDWSAGTVIATRKAS